jgi:dihydrofolate synthase/folylpolyglutamate synthase
MPRALNDRELTQIASGYGLKGEACGSVRNAYNKAKEMAGPNDLIFVGGSTFVAAEVI